MTKMAIACSVLAFGLPALVAAQSGTMDKMNKDMGKEMMVTGCVAQGEMGRYMLNNAMMSGDMKDMKMQGDMKGMSYSLMGGDLKPHVGHKVEVTGTMADDKMMGKDKMANDSMAKDSMGKSMGAMQTLNVKSVKMVSATCP